jgi:hypothetical protein
VAGALGGHIRVETIPTPSDCTDGFFEAFWNRPEALLDPSVRASQSMWALLPPGVEERIVGRLREALRSGAWDADTRTPFILDAAFSRVSAARWSSGGVSLAETSEPSRPD